MEHLELGLRNPSREQRIPVGSGGVDLRTAAHMLHCRITRDNINFQAGHAVESWRSRKIAFVQRLEWL
jgi:hypothetical protein